MAYLNEFIQLTFGGTTAQANEIWSCGIKIRQVGGILPQDEWFAQMSAELPAVGDLIETFVGGTNTKVPTTTVLTWAKMASIGTDGKYLEDAVEVQLNQAGYTSQAYSPQDAIVIGLVSDKWKDPGKNNRFYLPTAGPSGSGAWKLSDTEQTNLLNAAKTFLDGLNTALNPNAGVGQGQVAVLSNAGTGHESKAFEVRIGEIVDTQRRRRNKLPENYESLTLA